MSYSYYTQVFWGIEFPKERLQTKICNPEWNPTYPFSPITGQPIQKEFIQWDNSEDIAKKYNVEFIDQGEGGDYVYYGIKLSPKIDACHGDSTVDIKMPIEVEMKRVEEILQNIINDFGITQQQPKFRLVTQIC